MFARLAIPRQRVALGETKLHLRLAERHVALVLLGDVLSSAYQQAQLNMGIFSPDTVSVGDLFAGALVPGLLPGMTGHPPTVAHVMCAANGLFMALPATAVVLLLDRSRNPASWRVLLAAGAAGMSAFGMGAWHCPSVDPFHLIVAHAGLGAVLGLVVLGPRRRWRCRM